MTCVFDADVMIRALAHVLCEQQFLIRKYHPCGCACANTMLPPWCADWSFELLKLDEEHLAAVALGPVGWTLERAARGAATAAAPPNTEHRNTSQLSQTTEDLEFRTLTVEELLGMANDLCVLNSKWKPQLNAQAITNRPSGIVSKTSQSAARRV